MGGVVIHNYHRAQSTEVGSQSCSIDKLNIFNLHNAHNIGTDMFQK